MEKQTLEAKNEGQNKIASEKNAHSEAVVFVEKMRDFFEHYAGGQIKIKPAYEGLNTFAFNLENNTIYINSMFYQKLGFSEEKTVFATLHEIEHFMEKISLLAEDGGERIFAKYLKRLGESEAFSLMDNYVADIRENRNVVRRTNKGMGELEQKIYREDLFPEMDFIFKPKHIQFCNTILREARLPEEKCNVSPEVRQALEEISKKEGLMDIITHPETPMSLRFKLQDKYIWPKVQELLEKDIEDKNNKIKEENNQNEENKEGGEKEGKKGEKNQGNNQGEENKQDQNKNENKGEKGDKENPEDKQKNKDGDKKEQGDNENKDSGNKKGEKGKEDIVETNPNKIFAEDYKEAKKKFPEAVPLEEIKKAFEKWQEEKKKNNPEKIDEEYAKKIGVEKQDLQNYRKLAQELEKIVNPETNVSVIEELKTLFMKIISKRFKPALSPKYPVEEGDDLVDPAQLVADVKSGNLEPKVWEDLEIKDKKGDCFGEVEITLVCDRSSSMTDGNGQKAVEQRRSAVLMMEVLKEFAEICEQEKINIDKPLEIKSEIYSFASNEEDETPLKKMSKELGEAERINVLKKLHHLPGSTTDFVCLETIDKKLDDKSKQKIKEGELKKIVIVFTDGGSDDATRVQAVLKSLSKNGVIVVGVGLTEAGRSVEITYAPKAEVVENIADLPVVLGRLLKEHLKDL